MLTYYRQLLHELPFTEEGRAVLLDAGERLLTAASDTVLAAAAACTDEHTPLDTAAVPVREAAAALGIPARTANFVLVACASRTLRADFAKRGLSDTLFLDTMDDLCWKVRESRQVHGEWGLNGIGWYDLFFKGDLVRLGRLQYERFSAPIEEPLTLGGYTIHPGERVYNIHIPSNGQPLDRQSRLDSYRRAYDFFAAERGDKPLYGACLSWLLFPVNREIFPPHLNTVDFMNDFCIVGSEPNEFRDLWRVFGVPYTGDLSVLPRDNTMRRAFGDWLDRGGVPGYGIGLFVFDGERLITR